MIDPSVSVVVLTHDRLELLRRCLHSVLELDPAPAEVIVVDNASSDGTAAAVRAEFGPAVEVLERAENAPLAARNQGFARASGEVVLSLDDDIVLPARDALARIARTFRQHPRAAAVTFGVAGEDDPDRLLDEHWWHPVDPGRARTQGFWTDYFPEAAVAFRRDVLEAAGGYDEALWWDSEAVDLALRLIRDGHGLRYVPDLVAVELAVRGRLSTGRSPRNYLHLRNRLWLAWKHYPLPRALAYALPRVAIAAVRSVRGGWVDMFWRGLRDGLRPPAEVRSRRRPLPRSAFEELARIRAQTVA